MDQVLILTKNVLVEKEIQKKLQLLSYEVYCSSKIFETYHQLPKMREFFNLFQYVILSETLCETEVMELIPFLSNYSISIIRKVESNVTEADQRCLKIKQLNAIISSEDSVDELRECLYNLGTNSEQQQQRELLQLSGKVSLIRPNSLQKTEKYNEVNHRILETIHRLSHTEAKILSVLVTAANQVVTRETLCHKVWGEKATKSHLASLSSTITRIKIKFEEASSGKQAIHTLWGKGYMIDQKLLQHLQNENLLTSLV